jgi:hypothetical protein
MMLYMEVFKGPKKNGFKYKAFHKSIDLWQEEEELV